MARGKHGQTAQAKADGLALDRIRALEAELAAEREAHRRTRVDLHAAKDRDAGNLLAVKREAAEAAEAAMREEVEALQILLRTTELTLEEIQKAWDRASVKMLDHLHACQGGAPIEVVQHFEEWLGRKFDEPLVSAREQIAQRKLGSAGVRAIRTADRAMRGLSR